ncbi:bifunctional 2-polyprenyl-6-hydroxyphenol methylase/3-demethylubiquinol 3-O-methyltransferase UbiG [Quadrisphaera sp. DSM 44207]|uniref:class I SAM-dependent methyltransferase n=1 Tax=Quadrisphaera sp. DSM 44207 TaxID=1881057 RepID=UPI0008831BE0|nr:class I SAM-dependent methyltransferase [Quadrisphaera sp. DSM 44207]SDQ19186.1 Methyltransferase domain-containing protein [Quadrisphaera sp. DSM 44207]
MSEHEQDDDATGDDRPASGEFGAEYWEERYRRGEPTSTHGPSPSLVAEAGPLAPGLALDAGCGRGADAVWLASRGWRVTAVDVSAAALAHAQDAARAAGQDVADRIERVRADLTAWSPGERRFDLVTSSYVHVPGPAEDLFARLASWVAPGGTLLVVGHDGGPGTGAGDHGHGSHGHGGHGHAHPPGARIRAEQVTAGLPEDEWEVLVAEPRTHVVQRPDGAGAVPLDDVVVRARRIGPPRR